MRPKDKRHLNRRQFCRAATGSLGGLLLAAPVLRTKPDAPASVRKAQEIGPKESNMEGKIAGIKLKVISKKECALHEVGDEALVTETGVQGKVCIHALYSVLPKAFAMLYGVDFPWLSDPEVSTHACPDAANPVVFEVKRIRKAKN